MESQEIYYCGVRLSIDYTVYGKYIPATLETPEEHQTIEIKKITAYDSDVDLTSLLEQHETFIYEELLNNI
jgi:hypothetical protein